MDGIIATKVSDNRYDLAKTKRQNINLINSLYDKGHHIIIFTARGSVTGIDWTKTTQKQLRGWKVKYHQLLFGKPAADYYIDDRALTIRELQEIVLRINTDFSSKANTNAISKMSLRGGAEAIP